MAFIERFFKLSENNTNVRTEVYAGFTTFMTLAYILIVNPSILSATGMDQGALLTSTAVASAIATFAMAFLANYPFALAPGMGLNAYFAYTVVLKYGYSWQTALGAVFIEGVLFILLSSVNVREAIFESIPRNLKISTSIGIGLFVTFIGMQKSGIIIGDSETLIELGNIKSVPVALALIGTIITVFFVIRKVKGALLWGIFITYAMGIICQLMGVYVVNDSIGFHSLIPAGIVSAPPSIEPVFLKMNLRNAFSLEFVTVVFSFLFVDVFDTIGTLIGVSENAGYLDKDGKLPKIKGALLSDAIGTTAGAILGTSTVTTMLESTSGVSVGGRTGLTSVVTGTLFLVTLLFTPLITSIPTFATAPALITVGLFMIGNIAKINFKDYTEGFPAFISMVMTVFAYSISDGLIFGTLSYVLIKIMTGRFRELNPVIIIIAGLFFLKLILS